MESEESKRNNLKAAKAAFQKLKTEWAKHPSNLDVCGQLLADLKVKFYLRSFLIYHLESSIVYYDFTYYNHTILQVLLTELQFLPTKTDASEEELILARKRPLFRISLLSKYLCSSSHYHIHALYLFQEVV